MKKIISIFVLFFAFTLTSNAQSTEAKTINQEQTPEAKAKKDLSNLRNNMDMEDGKLADAMYGLFLYKHNALAKATNEQEKAEVSRIIDMKLKATFNSQQIADLEAVKGLYQSLIK